MPGADRREGADLVVVGASVGGLTAAITAADRGCQVILVERTKDLGGGAATAGEAVVAAGTRWQREAGVTDDPGRLAADVLASGVATEDGPLVSALATTSSSRSRPRAWRTLTAVTRWPTCGGSNVPPNTPMRSGTS